ncbi:MAG TPA: lipoate--protein ligase family protein [Pirellulales bacterium]
MNSICDPLLIPGRLIIDPPGEGAWNMALDEALLESAQNDGIASLRFYSWSEPTLSLGYFQPHAERRLHAASAHCTLVRRASGGGAILHDRELTYSIALPSCHPLAVRTEKLYRAVHLSLIETLAELGAGATLFGDAGRSASKPFLCFQRREMGDVVAGEFKIAGSAQRRQRGAVLQHGSVLLGQSAFAPELPGIAELFTGEVNIELLRTRWAPRLTSCLELDISSATTTTDSVLNAASEIARQKFGDLAWTERR